MPTNVYLYPGEAQPKDVVLRTQVSGNISASDSLSLGASDLSAIAPTFVVLVTIGLDDSAAPTVVAVITTTDSCAVQASESAALSGTSVIASDSCAVQVSEASPVISSSVVASDVNVVQASEGSASIASTVSMSDSTAGQVSEALSIVSTQSIVDSTGLTAGDLVSIFSTGTCTDTLSISLFETPMLALSFSTVESCAIQASDDSVNVVQNTLIAASDTTVIQASETAPIIGQVFVVADSAAVVGSDVNVGPHAVVADEAIVVGATEPLPVSALLTSASDAAPLQTSDEALPFASTSVSDSNAVQSSDVASMSIVGAATPITASDSCTLNFDDQLVPVREIAATDAAPLATDERIAALAIPAEVVALLLLESVHLSVTDVETYWGGGSRTEEAYFLYAGSYRMGERNPDETRGGKY